MEFDIDPQQFFDRPLLQVFLISPAFIGTDQFPELCPVIPEMIQPDRLITQVIINPVKSIAKDGGESMSDMKRLCDIGR